MGEAAAVAAGKAAGTAVGQIAAKLLEPLVDPMMEAGGAAARLLVLDAIGVSKPLVREPLVVIEDAKPDVAFGMDNDGVTDALHGIVWSSVKTMFVHPELADEFVMEMISEGVSNAMQYNLGGAVQAILNVWRGAYPLEPGEINDIVGNQLDVLDDAAAFVLMAMAGANIPATAAYATAGVNRLLQQEWGAGEARLVDVASRIESLALFFHTVAEQVATRVLVEAIEEPVTKAEHIANMLRYMYERAAARLQEYLAELYIMKYYKDAGVLKDESARQMAAVVVAEAHSLYEAVLEQESVLLSALDAVTTVDLRPVIDEVVAVLAEVARALVGAPAAAAEAAGGELDQLHSKLVSALTTLTMVRTYHRGEYETLPPVELVAQHPEAETPQPQERLPSVTGASSEQG